MSKSKNTHPGHRISKNSQLDMEKEANRRPKTTRKESTSNSAKGDTKPKK